MRAKSGCSVYISAFLPSRVHLSAAKMPKERATQPPGPGSLGDKRVQRELGEEGAEPMLPINPVLRAMAGASSQLTAQKDSRRESTAS